MIVGDSDLGCRVGRILERACGSVAVKIDVSRIERAGEGATRFRLVPVNPKAAAVEVVVSEVSRVIDVAVGAWGGFELPESVRDSLSTTEKRLEQLLAEIFAGRVREGRVYRRGRLATYSITIGPVDEPVMKNSWVESWIAALPIGHADVVEVLYESYDTRND